MSEKQRVRLLGVCFLILGVILYMIGETVFAVIMVLGGIITFIISDKASNLKEEDDFMDEDFKYSR